MSKRKIYRTEQKPTQLNLHETVCLCWQMRQMLLSYAINNVSCTS